MKLRVETSINTTQTLAYILRNPFGYFCAMGERPGMRNTSPALLSDDFCILGSTLRNDPNDTNQFARHVLSMAFGEIWVVIPWPFIRTLNSDGESFRLPPRLSRQADKAANSVLSSLNLKDLLSPGKDLRFVYFNTDNVAFKVAQST